MSRDLARKLPDQDFETAAEIAIEPGIGHIVLRIRRAEHADAGPGFGKKIIIVAEPLSANMSSTPRISRS